MATGSTSQMQHIWHGARRNWPGKTPAKSGASTCLIGTLLKKQLSHNHGQLDNLNGYILYGYIK